MKKSRAKKRAKPDSSGDAPQPLAERIEAQRNRIFKAMGVLSVCRLGSASLFDAEDYTDEFASALAAAHDLLDDVATELKEIASSKQRAAPS